MKWRKHDALFPRRDWMDWASCVLGGCPKILTWSWLSNFPLSQPLIEPAAPFGGGSGVRKSFGRRAATSTRTKHTPEIIQLTSWISSDKLAKLGFLLYPLIIPWMENMHFGTDKSTKLRTQTLKGAHIAPTQMITLGLITRIKKRNATSQVCRQ